MRHAVSCIGALLLTAVSASAPAAADTQVVLYSANDDTVNKLVVDGFKKETGITVNVVSTGSGVLFRRIASEATNPQGDVVWVQLPPARGSEVRSCPGADSTRAPQRRPPARRRPAGLGHRVPSSRRTRLSFATA